MRKKVISVLLLATLATSFYANAGNDARQASSFATFLGSAVILSPIWLPSATIAESAAGSTDNSEQDAKQKKDEETLRKERELKQRKDAVTVQVVNKQGQQQTLYLPKETYHKVNIKDGDKVDLEADENGVLLLKDGKPTYYYILEKNANKIVGQQPLVSQ